MLPAALTYEDSLRFDEQRRVELLAQLRSVLSVDHLTDLEASLQRRPLVKNAMVLTANSDIDAARVLTQFAATQAAIANHAAANRATDCLARPRTCHRDRGRDGWPVARTRGPSGRIRPGGDSGWA